MGLTVMVIADLGRKVEGMFFTTEITQRHTEFFSVNLCDTSASLW